MPEQENKKDIFYKIRYQLFSKIVVTYRIFFAAGKRFMKDDCLPRANSIAYSVVISIIPFFAILIKYAEIDQETIKANISRFMYMYGLYDATEVLRILDDILSRTNAIAGIGTIIMIITATNILRQLEDSFNFIYRSAKPRPILYRFSLHISALIVLPVLFIIVTTSIKYALNKITPASFTSIDYHKGKIYIAGSDGLLRIANLNQGARLQFTSIDLSEKIDRDTPFSDIYFDLKTGRYGYSYEIVGKTTPPLIKLKESFYSLKKISVTDSEIIAMTEAGVVFFSSDGGHTWKYQTINFKLESREYVPLFEDMIVTDNGKMLLLTTSGSESCIIAKKNEDYSLLCMNSVYNKFSLQPDGRILLLGIGDTIASTDHGESFGMPVLEKYGDRNLPIHAATFFQGKQFYAGANGSIWFHENGRVQYPDIRSDESIYGMTIQSNGNGFLYGQDGLFRWTADGGNNFLTVENKILNKHTIHDHILLPDGRFIFSGSSETLLVGKNPVLTGKRDSNGFPVVQIDVDLYHTFSDFKEFALQIIIYSGIYFIILIVYILLYKFLPDSRVSWISAAAGASLSALGLLIFLVGFRLYESGFSSTAYIYGVWAVIPVSLLVILTSTQITLFGLEISYVIQHPYLYKRVATDREELHDFWNCALLLTLIYHTLYTEGEPLTDEKAGPYFNDNHEALRMARDTLVAGRLMTYLPSESEYLQVKPPGQISFNDIHMAIFKETLTMPSHIPGNIPDSFKNLIIESQTETLKSMKNSGGETTIEDLLNHFIKNDKKVKKNN